MTSPIQGNCANCGEKAEHELPLKTGGSMFFCERCFHGRCAIGSVRVGEVIFSKGKLKISFSF